MTIRSLSLAHSSPLDRKLGSYPSMTSVHSHPQHTRHDHGMSSSSSVRMLSSDNHSPGSRGSRYHPFEHGMIEGKVSAGKLSGWTQVKGEGWGNASKTRARARVMGSGWSRKEDRPPYRPLSNIFSRDRLHTDVSPRQHI